MLATQQWNDKGITDRKTGNNAVCLFFQKQLEARDCR